MVTKINSVNIFLAAALYKTRLKWRAIYKQAKWPASVITLSFAPLFSFCLGIFQCVLVLSSFFPSYCVQLKYQTQLLRTCCWFYADVIGPDAIEIRHRFGFIQGISTGLKRSSGILLCIVLERTLSYKLRFISRALPSSGTPNDEKRYSLPSSSTTRETRGHWTVAFSNWRKLPLHIGYVWCWEMHSP